MCWYVPGDEIEDGWDPVWPVSATDGDMDIAFGLLLADAQWGGNSEDPGYLAKARERIAAIQENNLETDSDFAQMYYYLNTADSCGPNGTNQDAGRRLSRPSDWMVGHMKLFAAVVQNDNDSTIWNQAADDASEMLKSIISWADNTNSLVPDFVRIDDGNGDVIPVAGPWDPELWEYPCDIYNYNACRVPWRIAR